MKTITVSIDEHTHHQVRIKAAEMGVPVSALVRNYLKALVAEHIEKPAVNNHKPETSVERRQRLKTFFEEFDARGRGISEILPREAVYDRDALR